MLNIIQNTIGAIRRVGESVVRAGLKMWLPFTKVEPLGEELVVNGDFSTNSDWSFGANTIITGGKLVCSNSSAYNSTSQSISMKAGTYIVTYTIDSISGGVIYFGFDGINGVNRNTSGTYTEYLEVPLNSSNLYIVPTANGIEFEISNVSVEEYAQETPDISGNDNNAILKTGKALVFHANDSLETSFPTSKDIKTIAFWIYPTGSNTNETLFWFGGSFFGSKYVLINQLTLESSPYARTDFDVYVDGAFAGATFGGQSVTLVQDQWQRVVLKSSTAINVTSDTFNVAGGAAAGGQFKMSDLQIYGAEFTTDDIAYDYANPQKLVTDNASSNVTLNDLHAWWHMSEGDGTIAFDSAPISNGNIDGETYDGSSLGATYDDAQERIPQLGMMNWSKGSNLLEYSEDFSEWTNVSSGTGSQVVLTENQLAPDGTLTATKMFFDKGTGSANSDFSILQRPFTYQSNTASVYLRADTAQKIMIRSSNTFQLFDVSTDWVRINKTDIGGAFKIGLRSGYGVGEPNTSTIYVWGAQVESGTTASAYRRTNGTAVTDATLISCATDSQKDILGNAVRVKGSGFNLDGTGYGEVPHTTDFDFGTGDFSVSAWVKGSYVNQGSSINVIFSSGVGASNSDTSSLVAHSTDKLGFYCGGTTISADSTFLAGNWYHVVGVRDSGTIKLYVDKVLQTEIGSNTNSITNTENKFIGFDNTASRFYNDLIDDVQVYKNVALSVDEITQNYNATKSGHNN